MIDLYINTAFINYKNVNLTIISHPHRKHLTLDYQVSVSKLINEVIANSKFRKMSLTLPLLKETMILIF